MIKPDLPINSASDDLLGRTQFSESFGKALLAYKETESIVAALYGGWGCGKSSVINMTLEYIDSVSANLKPSEKPIVVKFNPWNFSNQNQLVSQFFRELSHALRRKDTGAEVAKIGEKLEVYANLFTPLALIPEPTISASSLVVRKVFKSVGGAAKAWGAAYSKDFDAVRGELNELLEQQGRKIIIVLDDIDRLTSIEIRQMFQLVKMLGDFPNTIYLLSFDRDVVTTALSKVQEGNGNDYLEKIVQFPVEMPPISRGDIEKIFFAALDEIVKDIPQSEWDQSYWANIYHTGVKHFSKTLRDIIRYINSLRFSYEMIKDEVNAVDFIAVTGIQIFEPNIFYGIRDNKDLFTKLIGHSSRGDEAEKTQASTRMKEILERAKVLESEVLNEFLVELFPNIETLLGNMSYGHESSTAWRRNRRICHPDVFDVYFQLSIPSDEIPQTEMKALIELASNRDAFAEAISRLTEDGKIYRFLELLEDYTEEGLSSENAQNIAAVLMDMGDLFPEEEVGFFGFDTKTRVMRILNQIDSPLPTHETRYELIRNAIEQAEKSIHTIVFKVGLLGQEHGKATDKSEEQLKPMEQRKVNPTQLESLEQLAADKIRAWAADGRLDVHPNLLSILFSWRRWQSQNVDQVQAFLDSLSSTDDGLLKLLAGFAHKTKSQSAGEYTIRTNWRIDLDTVSKFIDPESIEPRIRSIFNSPEFDGLDVKYRQAVEIFLDTFDGKIEDW